MEELDTKAVIRAVKNGDVEAVRDYLKANPSCIQLRDEQYNATLLHWACDRQQAHVALALLRKRADPNAKNRMQETPLHWACLHGDLNIMKLLVKYKGDVLAKDGKGKTVSNLAKEHGLTEISRWLAEYIADPAGSTRSKSEAPPDISASLTASTSANIGANRSSSHVPQTNNNLNVSGSDLAQSTQAPSEVEQLSQAEDSFNTKGGEVEDVSVPPQILKAPKVRPPLSINDAVSTQAESVGYTTTVANSPAFKLPRDQSSDIGSAQDPLPSTSSNPILPTPPAQEKRNSLAGLSEGLIRTPRTQQIKGLQGSPSPGQSTLKTDLKDQSEYMMVLYETLSNVRAEKQALEKIIDDKAGGSATLGLLSQVSELSKELEKLKQANSALEDVAANSGELEAKLFSMKTERDGLASKAIKADEYKRLNDDMEGQIQALQKQIAHLKDIEQDVKRLSAEKEQSKSLQELVNIIAGLEEEKRSMEAAVHELDSMKAKVSVLEEDNTKHAQTAAQLPALRQQLVAAQEEKAALEHRHAEESREMKAKLEEHDQTKWRVKHLETEKQHLETQLSIKAAMEHELVKAQKEKSVLSSEVGNLQGQLLEVEQKSSILAKDLAMAKAEASRLENDSLTLRQEAAQARVLQAKLAAVEKEQKQTSERESSIISTLSAELLELNRKVGALEPAAARVSALEAEKSGFLTTLQSQQQELDRLRSSAIELSSTQQQFQAMEQEKKMLQDEVRGMATLRTELKILEAQKQALEANRTEATASQEDTITLKISLQVAKEEAASLRKELEDRIQKQREADAAPAKSTGGEMVLNENKRLRARLEEMENQNTTLMVQAKGQSDSALRISALEGQIKALEAELVQRVAQEQSLNPTRETSQPLSTALGGAHPELGTQLQARVEALSNQVRCLEADYALAVQEKERLEIEHATAKQALQTQVKEQKQQKDALLTELERIKSQPSPPVETLAPSPSPAGRKFSTAAESLTGLEDENQDLKLQLSEHLQAKEALAMEVKESARAKDRLQQEIDSLKLKLIQAQGAAHDEALDQPPSRPETVRTTAESVFSDGDSIDDEMEALQLKMTQALSTVKKAQPAPADPSMKSHADLAREVSELKDKLTAVSTQNKVLQSQLASTGLDKLTNQEDPMIGDLRRQLSLAEERADIEAARRAALADEIEHAAREQQILSDTLSKAEDARASVARKIEAEAAEKAQLLTRLQFLEEAGHDIRVDDFTATVEPQRLVSLPDPEETEKWQSMLADYDALCKQVEAYEKEKKEMATKLAWMDDTQTQLNATVAAQAATSTDLMNRLNAAETARQELQSKLSASRTALVAMKAMLGSEISSLRRDLTYLRSTCHTKAAPTLEDCSEQLEPYLGPLLAEGGASEALQADNQALSAEKAALQGEGDALRKERDELLNQLTKSHEESQAQESKQVEQLLAEIAELQKQLAKGQEDAGAQESKQVEQLLSEIAELQNQLAKQNEDTEAKESESKQVEQLLAEIARLQKDLDDRDGQLEVQKAKLVDTVQNSTKDHSSEVAKLKQLVSEKTYERKEIEGALNSKIFALQSTIQGLEREKLETEFNQSNQEDELKRSHERLLADSENLKSKQRLAAEEIEQKNEMVASLQEKTTDLLKQISALEVQATEERGQQLQLMYTLKAQVGDLKENKETLQRKVVDLEKEMVRVELQAQKDARQEVKDIKDAMQKELEILRQAKETLTGELAAREEQLKVGKAASSSTKRMGDDHMQILQQQLADKEASEAELKRRVAALDKQLLRMELQSQKEARDQVEALKEAMQSEIIDLKADVKARDQQLAHERETVSKLFTEAEDLRARVSHLQEQGQLLREKIEAKAVTAASTEENAVLSSQNEALRHQVTNSQAMSKDLQEELQQSQNLVKTLREEQKSLQQRLWDLESGDMPSDASAGEKKTDRIGNLVRRIEEVQSELKEIEHKTKSPKPDSHKSMDDMIDELLDASSQAPDVPSKAARKGSIQSVNESKSPKECAPFHPPREWAYTPAVEGDGLSPDAPMRSVILQEFHSAQHNGRLKILLEQEHELSQLRSEASLIKLAIHEQLRRVEFHNTLSPNPRKKPVMSGAIFPSLAPTGKEALDMSSLTPLQQIYVQKCQEHGVGVNQNFLRSLPEDAKDLTEINISRNYMGRKGVMCITDLLDVCPSINCINFSDNKLDNDAIIQFCQKATKHPSLKEVVLSSNLFSKSAGRAILQMLQTNMNIQKVVVEPQPFLIPTIQDRIQAQATLNQQFQKLSNS